MSRFRPIGPWGILGAAIVLSWAAQAGTRTYVTLAGSDDAMSRLGRPGIRVRVEASSASDAAFVRRELARELAHQVHTRELGVDEPGDYDLAITLKTPLIEGPMTIVPFDALLDSARGERLWRITGHSDVDGFSLDASVFAGIGRNVISALIHDSWVQPRYDPDDPPPPSPNVRTENTPR